VGSTSPLIGPMKVRGERSRSRFAVPLALNRLDR
jgi:hypothetical protein